MIRVLTTCMLIALCLAWPVQGAVEDFTEWTAVDPLGVYTIDETSVTATNLERKTQTYVYRDWGANYWDDDWQFQFEFTPGAVSHTTGAYFGVVTLANNLGSWHQIQYIKGVGVRYDRSATGYWLRLDWSNYPTLISSTPTQTLTVATKYYCTFIRDRDGGAAEQGRFTLHVCTTNYYGETGAVIVETQTLDVPAGERVDYRYTFVAQNRSNGGLQVQTGTVENLDLDAGTPPPEEPPAKVTTPNPANAATSVPISSDLSWAASTYADNYDIYLSETGLDINDYAIGNTEGITIDPGALEYATEYQWRVDANNAYGLTDGDLWTFTTAAEPVEPEPGDYYYVDPIAGNDSSGSGTLAAPWKTMAKAEAESEPNDAIFILGWNSTLEDEDWPTDRWYFAEGVYSNSVTWTFSTTHRIGRFATGDFWVVGPVSVEGISPASVVTDGSTRNGSMVNPVTNTFQGFDSRSNQYSATLNVGYGVGPSTPLAVANGSSLLSAISLSAASDASYVGKIAVLTVLDTVPDPNSFRPSYFGTDKTVNWNADDLDYDVLGTLDANDVGVSGTVPNLSTVAGYFRRPWVSFVSNWMGRTMHPVQNGMPAYGRDRSVRLGIGGLLLQLDLTNEQKKDLATYITQIGIDWYGVASHPGGRTTWIGNGGHCMGHKFPILFAGTVLGDNNMIALMQKSGAYLWSAKPGGGNYGPGDIPPDYIYFQEDMQTFYVDRFMVDLPLVTSVSGYAIGATTNTITIDNLPKWSGQPEHQYVEITSGPGAGQKRYITSSNYNRSTGGVTTVTVSENWTTTPTTSSQYRLRGYESEQIGMAEWGINHATNPARTLPSWNADYRYINGVAYPGWTLAAWIMDLKDAWNHDPLFDYVDRWMFETSDEGDHAVDNRTNSAFVEAMWVTFRDNYPLEDQPPAKPRSPVPADGAALIHPFTSTLSWTATMDDNIPTYAEEFEVYFGTDAESLSSIGPTTELYIDLPDYLEYGATYYWRVDATNPQGVTVGNVWSFTTESGVPDQVTGGSPANGQANVAVSRNLTWPAASGASSYAVYLDGDLLATTTTRSVAVTLAYDTTYTWRVDAIGPGGTTTGSTMTFSTVASATVDPDPPGLPDLPGLGRRYVVPTPVASRSDRMTSRYSTQYEGLRAEEVTLTESGVFAIETTSGYLEGIVVLPEGSDTSWSLTVADAWGAQLFSDTLDMTEGVVAWYGQRLPFVEGLQITVDDLDGTAYLKLLFNETWRR